MRACVYFGEARVGGSREHRKELADNGIVATSLFSSVGTALVIVVLLHPATTVWVELVSSYARVLN